MLSKMGPSELQPVIIGAALAIAIFVGGKISGGNNKRCICNDGFTNKRIEKSFWNYSYGNCN